MGRGFTASWILCICSRVWLTDCVPYSATLVDISAEEFTDSIACVVASTALVIWEEASATFPSRRIVLGAFTDLLNGFDDVLHAGVGLVHHFSF